MTKNHNPSSRICRSIPGKKKKKKEYLAINLYKMDLCSNAFQPQWFRNDSRYSSLPKYLLICVSESSWATAAVLFYWKRVHSSLKADRHWFKIQLYYYWLQSISDHALLFHLHKEPQPWTQVDIKNYHLPLLITYLPQFKSVHNAIAEHRWGICKLINDWCPNKKV